MKKYLVMAFIGIIVFVGFKLMSESMDFAFDEMRVSYNSVMLQELGK